MGLESGTYISQLNSSNPTTSDDVAEGDDHLRLIKAVLKNQFSGLSGTTAISASEAELNIMDGVTSTAAELNILDGVTSTAAELNILDGVTSTAAELNILDGVTSTAAELNIVDGVTATATELNYNDVTTLGTVQTSKTVTADSSGTINCVDYIVQRPRFTDYAETKAAMSANAVDLTLGNVQTYTLSGNQTLTFTNPPATGKSGSFTLMVTNGGSATLTWPGTVDWPDGSAPSLTSSGLDVLVFTTIDAGTTWLGFTAGLDVKSP